MNYAIRVEDLEKSYGSHKVLRGLSFEVRAGEIFALLGANGAGKTTTLECVEGLRSYDKGRIDLRGRCGVQLQSTSLPKNMKAREALALFAAWRGASVPRQYVESLGVDNFLNRQYEQLSVGQKRRLHLAIALLGGPDILILDEPTAGLDVEGRVSIHAQIKALRENGATIVLASHDMAEVEELCDSIAILKNGRIAFYGSPAKLIETTGSDFVLKLRFSASPSPELFAALPEVTQDRGYYEFDTPSIEETLGKIVLALRGSNISIRDVQVEQVDIERRFLEIA